MAQETPYREMDTRGFGHCYSVYEKRLEATMTDIVTYCDVNTCEDCPRYGDDCDGDKRVEHTDLISRADAIEMAVDVETPEGTYESAIYVDDLMALPSADAVQGEWIEKCGELVCSVCGNSVSFSRTPKGWVLGKFCQTCGAKMGGDGE